MTALLLNRYHLRLRFLSSGRTVAWLGPALKGMVAATLKECVCRWPKEVRQRDWTYCRGCPHLPLCSYGQTFEPEVLAERTVMPTADDGQRAVAIAPQFPAPLWSDRNLRWPVQISLIGAAAARAERDLLAAVSTAARRRALGPDRIRFLVEEHTFVDRLRLTADDLARPLDFHQNCIPRVRLKLTAPLFLRGEGVDRRHLLEPSFSDLLRGCLRTVGRAFDRFGDGPLLNINFRGLKAAALLVENAGSRWRPFRQGHRSSRSGQHWQYVGVTGEATFRNVPAPFLPWLLWGGRLGVGEHRICGAGRWDVQLDGTV